MSYDEYWWQDYDWDRQRARGLQQEMQRQAAEYAAWAERKRRKQAARTVIDPKLAKAKRRVMEGEDGNG